MWSFGSALRRSRMKARVIRRASPDDLLHLRNKPRHNSGGKATSLLFSFLNV
jgi:hypothetical protein